MRPRSWWLAAAFAGGVFAAPAGAQDPSLEIDYLAVRKAMPQMQELAQQGNELATGLHKTMDALDSTQDELKQRELREQLRGQLEAYRAKKLESIDVIRPLVNIPTTDLTDEQILEKIRNTELNSVVWDNTFFDKCIRDLSGALEIPIRLQYRVVQKNTVTMRFQKAPAETILATLLNGFDLRYVIHGGEIVIYKKITPTEERFLDYQKRHPEVKLKYWEQEDASGAVDTKKKGGGK